MTTLSDMTTSAIAALRDARRSIPALPTAGTVLRVQCGDTTERLYLPADATSSGNLWILARRLYDDAIDCGACSESEVFLAQVELYEEWIDQVEHARAVIDRAINATRYFQFHRALKLVESLENTWWDFLDTEARRTADTWVEIMQPAEEALLACRDHEPRGAQVVGL